EHLINLDIMNTIHSQKTQILLLSLLGVSVIGPLATQAQLPVIVKAPQGTSILVGSGVSVSVQASSGAPLTYQWLLNSASLAGATSSSYSTPYAQKANEGDYQVVVGNNSGAITSVVARVSVVTADQTNITDRLVGHYPFEQQFADLSPSGNAAS